MSAALRLHIPVSAFRDALSEVLPAVPSRTTLPALECLRLAAHDGILEVTATDLEVRITRRLPAEVVTSGVALVPAKLLSDIVRSLDKSDAIQLECHDTTLTVETPYGRYQIAGLPAGEFPQGEEVPESVLELGAEAVEHIVRSVLFAASDDPLRPALTGVLFEGKPHELCVVATDGYRLSRLRIPLETATAGTCLVPANTVELLRHAREPVRMGWNEHVVAFSTAELTIVGRLLQEKFPAYEQVIPSQTTKRFRANRQKLLDALGRVSLFSGTQLRIVRLRFTHGGVTCEAENEERGDRAYELVPGEYTGEEFLIGFNARYLSEALRAADTDEILLEFTEPTKPVVIRRVQEEELPIAESGLVILAMPVRL
ncbi:DNA polymerase III subunit beta [bacterium HR21]|nr:DNA polymerase III subunit beta [bacterium HR21]